MGEKGGEALPPSTNNNKNKQTGEEILPISNAKAWITYSLPEADNPKGGAKAQTAAQVGTITTTESPAAVGIPPANTGEEKQAEFKVWITLSTFAANRAIHMELVMKIDGEQTIMAIERFTSRRGKPFKENSLR